MRMSWIDRLLRRSAEPAHLRTGRWGEQRAVRLLKSKHYRVLGKRVRVGSRDEIDIVASDRNTMVFVEVKTRGSETFGRPFSAVDAGKRRRLSRAAVAYLRKIKTTPDHIRFDVIEVIGRAGRPVEIRHIENAFPLDPAYRLWW
jgi:putative endonuclease